jgi:phage terminase small subunit
MFPRYNARMRALNLNQQRFVAELFASVPMNATAAYQRAYPSASYDTAKNEAYLLMNDERVVAEIAKWKNELRDDLRMDAAQIIKELTLIASADPRELSEHHIGSCRYCHGDGFKYHRTPREFDELWGVYLAKHPEDPLGLSFDMQGGVGFNARKPPNPACPECFGIGIGYEIIKDTSNLSPGAARLYSGVKRTKDGIEIKTRDQSKALELAGQTLGLFRTGLELGGKGGGPIPIAAVVALTNDPIEASKLYQSLVQGA